MALANFFDKSLLNASQVLNEFEITEFESILNSQYVGIAYDHSINNSKEGVKTLDLLIRILARLYPNLQIINICNSNTAVETRLKNIALEINPKINLSTEISPTVCIIVGNSEHQPANCKCFYIGSKGWIFKLSTTAPVESGHSNNPLGAGAAACLGAANVFRYIFKDKLNNADNDSELCFSLFDFNTTEINIENDYGDSIENFQFGEATLVGIGAIGNAVLWTLRNIDSATGRITVIDNEKISLTNLQRYVLTSQSNISPNEIYKVDLAKEQLKATKIKVMPIKLNWQEFFSQAKNKKIEKILVAVDSAKARIEIQSGLPKKIFNSWTQLSELGTSSHLNFLDEKACLMCLYIPDGKVKSKSELISEALQIPQYEPTVRKYLALNLPLDKSLLNIISLSINASHEKLEAYIGKPLEIFYSEVVCGGVLMQLTGKTIKQKQIEVPTAFESALAGILLVSEFIKDALGSTNIQESNKVRLNLLRQFNPKTILDPELKRPHFKCICQDDDFTNSYKKKWNL